MSKDDGDKQNKTDQNGEGERRSEKSATDQTPPPTLLEWGVRAVSLGLVLLLTGYIVYSAFLPPSDTTFDYTVNEDKIEERNGAWVVPVAIKNTGSKSLSTLEIALQLLEGDDIIEEETASFALLGANETVDTVYWFSEDPRQYELNFDVAGYNIP